MPREPGRLVGVGDPKQSIYAFRRADIEAYLEVVEKIIKAQNGFECRLTTNFRSNAAILNLVNGVFTTLMQAREGLQPSYLAIHPAPDRLASATGGAPEVLIRKTIAAGGAIEAETARQLEGESLARWLREAILGKAEILNAQVAKVTAQPKDVALLLRKLTDIHDYLEPLRRHNIRYVVEGERHFYAAKEIIDDGMQIAVGGCLAQKDREAVRERAGGAVGVRPAGGPLAVPARDAPVRRHRVQPSGAGQHARGSACRDPGLAGRLRGPRYDGAPPHRRDRRRRP